MIRTQAALGDMKVLDLTHYIAGPYCTKLLADLGAEAVKIERPGAGDGARRLGPFPGDLPHSEKSGLFLHLNTNKKSVTLDLKSATGKRILKELAAQADVVVESFEPRVMPSLGLGYETLAAVNPGLVMTSISNFGQTGPYRDWQATEIVSYALSTNMISTGVPDREPLKLGLTVSQFQAGNVAAVATLGAFLVSSAQGVGQQVDVSIMEVLASSIDRAGPCLTAVAYSGEASFVRAYGKRFSLLPFGVYPCKDGYVHFNSAQFPWWRHFCRMIGHPELGDSPEYTDPDVFYDLRRTDEIDALFYPWLMEHTKREVMEAGGPIAGSAVNTMADLFDDPHFKAREFFQEVAHPIAGTFLYPGAPFKMQETPWRAGRAPLLGEHNEEVLCGRLGYSKEDLVRLRELNII